MTFNYLLVDNINVVNSALWFDFQTMSISLRSAKKRFENRGFQNLARIDIDIKYLDI